MKRNCNIELFRCICMFGVVCIHAFTWTEHVSYRLWALSFPSLIGFIMISAWFGIHFRFRKLVRLIGTVVFCSAITLFFDNGGGGWNGYLLRIRSYWYVWAYVFVMLFAPVVDGFVENCMKRKDLVCAFISLGILLWGWSFIAMLKVSPYIPTSAGFNDCSGVILLCVYTFTRLMRRLGWTELIGRNVLPLFVMLVISGGIVSCGFRHTNSIFAFVYALAMFLLVIRIPLKGLFEKMCVFLGPSMFSVYLFHVPLSGFFPSWESTIHSYTLFPHAICQLGVAIMVFFVSVVLDMPRRLLVVTIISMEGRIHRAEVTKVGEHIRRQLEDKR